MAIALAMARAQATAWARGVARVVIALRTE